jgi:hypothetical protein
LSRAATAQKSKEFRTFTVERRGKDRDIRVPQFSKELTGERLLRAVGRAAFDHCGDPNAIIKTMTGWLAADFKLRERVVGPMIEFAVRNIADDLVRSTRTATRGAVSQPSEGLLASYQSIGRKNIAQVMDFQVKHGLKWIRLGDCTKEILLEAALHREKSASTMAADAAWLRKIAKQLTEKQKVEDALKPADVERFRDQAHKDVA